MEKFMTAKQVSEYYGVCPKTVLLWIYEKKLITRKVGGQYRITQDDLKAFEDLCNRKAD